MVLTTITDIFTPIAATTVVQRIPSIFPPVAYVLAAITHILSTVPHVLASVPNVFAPVTPVFETVAHHGTVRPSMRVSVLRAQGGRRSSHQGRGDRGHSEIAHRIPQRQILRSPSWRALLIRRPGFWNVKACARQQFPANWGQIRISSFQRTVGALE